MSFETSPEIIVPYQEPVCETDTNYYYLLSTPATEATTMQANMNMETRATNSAPTHEINSHIFSFLTFLLVKFVL